MEKQEKIRKERAFKSMLIFGIFSSIMFFAGLTSAYIVSKGTLLSEGKWDIINMPISFRFSTIAIVLSSFAAFISFSDLKKNNLKSSDFYLKLTLVFGIVFSFFQYRGWKELVNEGHFFTGEGSNIAFSFMCVLTGAHLVHVIAGLIVVIVLLVRLRIKKDTHKNYLGFKLGLWFWHFLGVLWIYLYGFLWFSTSNNETKKWNVEEIKETEIVDFLENNSPENLEENINNNYSEQIIKTTINDKGGVEIVDVDSQVSQTEHKMDYTHDDYEDTPKSQK